MGLSKAEKKQAKKIAQSVVNKVVETKTSCIAVGATSASSSGYLKELSLLSQGDQDYAREGSQVKATKLQLRGYVESDSTDVHNAIRLMLVKAKPGAIPGLADMPTVYGCIRPQMRTVYTIIYDKVHQMNTHVSGTVNRRALNWSFGLKNQMIKFDSTGASNASIGGGVFLYVVSDSTATPHPEFSFESQLYFKG